MTQRNPANGKFELSIFANFLVDRNLPKFENEPKHDEWNSLSLPNFDNNNNIVVGRHNKPKIFFEKLFGLPKNKKQQTAPPKPEPIDYSEVKTFFDNIKRNSSTQTLNTKSVGIMTKCLEQLKNAKASGQTALYEILSEKHKVVSYEVLLEMNEIKNYVESETIIKYYQMLKHKELLKLVYIKNFARIIPTEIVNKKVQADKLKVFDNYVVLGFDKSDTMNKMTKREIEKAKDPILFGVIKGSDRLYFIGDWEDEHCDLSIDEILAVTSTRERVLSEQTILNN